MNHGSAAASIHRRTADATITISSILIIKYASTSPTIPLRRASWTVRSARTRHWQRRCSAEMRNSAAAHCWHWSCRPTRRPGSWWDCSGCRSLPMSAADCSPWHCRTGCCYWRLEMWTGQFSNEWISGVIEWDVNAADPVDGQAWRHWLIYTQWTTNENMMHSVPTIITQINRQLTFQHWPTQSQITNAYHRPP